MRTDNCNRKEGASNKYSHWDESRRHNDETKKPDMKEQTLCGPTYRKFKNKWEYSAGVEFRIMANWARGC